MLKFHYKGSISLTGILVMPHRLSSSPLAAEDSGGGRSATAFPPILPFPHQGGRDGDT
jgi:hypothetical protein